MNYKNYGSKDTQRFEIHEGGGCLSFFGFPFFCAGIFLLLAALKIIPFQNKDEIPFWGWIGMFFMSLPFIGIGGALLFGRRKTRIDLSEGRIFKESKVFVPVKTETYLIVDYKTVMIRFESGSSDSPDSYPVVLMPSHNGRPLPLYSGSSYADSREFAAAVSQFLKFPLEDVATGHKSLVEPEDATKSLKERLINETGIEKTPRPFSMRSEVIEESGVLRIRIPPSGFKIPVLIPLAAVLVFLGFLVSKIPSALVFFRESRTPDTVQYVILGVGALFFILPLSQAVGAVIAALRNDTVVQLKSDELTIAERKSWTVKTIRIPVQEIYDIDYGSKDFLSENIQTDLEQQGGDPDKVCQVLLHRQDYANTWWGKALQTMVASKGIILKTRRSLFSFGAGLDDEELRYLCSLLKGKFLRS